MPKGTRNPMPWGAEISGRVPRCERTYSAMKSVKERSPSERLKKGIKAPPWRDAALHSTPYEKHSDVLMQFRPLLRLATPQLEDKLYINSIL